MSQDIAEPHNESSFDGGLHDSPVFYGRTSVLGAGRALVCSRACTSTEKPGPGVTLIFVFTKIWYLQKNFILLSQPMYVCLKSAHAY